MEKILADILGLNANDPGVGEKILDRVRKLVATEATQAMSQDFARRVQKLISTTHMSLPMAMETIANQDAELAKQKPAKTEAAPAKEPEAVPQTVPQKQIPASKK